MADVPPAHEEGRQASLPVLRARLGEQAQAVRSPEDWARCLRLAALLPGESFANVVLISAQRPDATMIRGYRAWQSIGRQVSRQECGTEIFSAARPARAKHAQPRDQDSGEPMPDWREATRVARVWDLAQTTGRPVTIRIPVPAPPGEVQPGLLDALCWLARREGYPVEREHGCPADGTTMWTARRIRVSPEPGAAAVWALAHQLGHVLLHNDGSHPAGETTSGCTGVRKAEADSVAFIICDRYGLSAGHLLPHPQAWAGRDPRAQPGTAILATGQRITEACAPVTGYLDRTLPGREVTVGAPHRLRVPAARAGVQPAAEASRAQPPRPARDPEAAARNARVLGDAHAYYIGRLTGSWVPGYLRSRGIDDAATTEWGIGYSPHEWTALTEHLRSLGHDDNAIQAAGLARPSSRGTLIDHFRDRVMLPVHDEDGMLAGFIGRARPGAPPEVPKYLNSPETSSYHKSELLFGLHQARAALARGAIPTFGEGPFDAIAVSIADPGRHAGVAPCGSALTNYQAALLSTVANLPSTGVITAFDSDAAGRKASIRAYSILRPYTGKLQSALLARKDPAETLQRDGPLELRAILRERLQPLCGVILDDRLATWERRLGDSDGPYQAMLNMASLVAGLLPADAADLIRRVTQNRELRIADDLLRPIACPELLNLAHVLPGEVTYQIMHVADRLGCDYSDVLAQVANTVIRTERSPKAGDPATRDEAHRRASPDRPARRAASSFPRPPLAEAPAVWPAQARRPASPVRVRAAQRPC